MNGIECLDDDCQNDTWVPAQDSASHDYACKLCGFPVKVKKEDGQITVESLDE